ncbi:MAG: hypothetical protein M9905_05125 [Rhizobiaceae bacterium]|nr:hypothetical protein [Rhizobiaceae bacterium]
MTRRPARSDADLVRKAAEQAGDVVQRRGPAVPGDEARLGGKAGDRPVGVGKRRQTVGKDSDHRALDVAREAETMGLSGRNVIMAGAVNGR